MRFSEAGQARATIRSVLNMTGGDLKIEVLPAGAVVPAFGLLDAVSKGTLDGGHGVLVYHYGKQNALALWGSGPAYAMDGNMVVSRMRGRPISAEGSSLSMLSKSAMPSPSDRTLPAQS